MYKQNVVHVSAQINLKDYASFILHSILIKPDMYNHWVNAHQKHIGIRPRGIPRGELKGLNFVAITFNISICDRLKAPWTSCYFLHLL